MSSRRAATAKVVARKPAVMRSSRAMPAGAAGGKASDLAMQLGAEVERALAQGHTDVLTPEAVQALMAAACRVYSAQAEAGGDCYPALGPRSGVTATDVMTVASGLLQAVNLAVFELGMWQSWTGR